MHFSVNLLTGSRKLVTSPRMSPTRCKVRVGLSLRGVDETHCVHTDKTPYVWLHTCNLCANDFLLADHDWMKWTMLLLQTLDSSRLKLIVVFYLFSKFLVTPPPFWSTYRIMWLHYLTITVSLVSTGDSKFWGFFANRFDSSKIWSTHRRHFLHQTWPESPDHTTY